MTFDPHALLPGPPSPWKASSMPEPRDGPPYLMTEMIAAEPALAERIVRRLATDPAMEDLVEAVRATAGAGHPVLLTGCGTSEHAAMGIAALLAAALRQGGLPAGQVSSVQAFELAGRLPEDGLLLGVSHEGGTQATNLALERARAAGLATALITAGPDSPGAALVEHVVATGEQDQSWCHTVGYFSPLVAGAALSGAVSGEPLDAIAVRALVDASDQPATAEEMAASLARCGRVLVVGSGIDYVSARELALKIEEGTHLPANAHQLETIRHGHLAAADASTGLVLLLTDGESRGAEVFDRARSVLRAAEALGMPAAAIVAADLGDDIPLELTPAGRCTVPLAAELSRIVCAVLGAAVPLQLLTERLARARGVNPDTLGREDPRQAAAGDA